MRELKPQQSPASQQQEDALLEFLLTASYREVSHAVRADIRYTDNIRNLAMMTHARILMTCGDPQHVRILAALRDRTHSQIVRDEIEAELRHVATHHLGGQCFGCYLRTRNDNYMETL